MKYFKAVCICQDEYRKFVKNQVYECWYESSIFGSYDIAVARQGDFPYGLKEENFKKYFIKLTEFRKLKLQKINSI